MRQDFVHKCITYDNYSVVIKTTMCFPDTNKDILNIMICLRLGRLLTFKGPWPFNNLSFRATSNFIKIETLHLFLALLNRFAIHRGYVIPNFCIVHLRHSSHCQLFVKKLSLLKFIDRLTSNFT